MRLMDRLRERYGTTILMITHDVRLVAEWADRAIALRGGGPYSLDRKLGWEL